MVSAVWEHEQDPGLTRRYVRAAIVVLVLLLVAAGVLIVADRVLQPNAFPVQRVSFEGPFHRVKPAQLRRAVTEAVKGNFFTLDLSKVEAAARRVPWVDRVSVRREWPRAIHIQYTEYQLAAHWGSHGWLTRDGKVVDLPDAGAQSALPYLDGPPGSEQVVTTWYRKLAAELEPAALQLTRLAQTERRAWLARVAPRAAAAGAGFEIVLGRQAIARRLDRFVEVYPTVLAARAADIARVDLRYPNGFAVAWRKHTGAPAASTLDKRSSDDKKGG